MAQPSKPARRKILLVDDCPELLEPLADGLQDEFEVRCEGTGRAALEAARAFHPELILLDLHLPDLDGYEICKQLRRDPETATIPVILVTGDLDPSTQIKGFELGAIDYVAKPFDQGVLLARIRTRLPKVEAASGDSALEIKIANLRVFPTKKHAWLGETALALSDEEFRLLLILAQRAEQIVEWTTLPPLVWPNINSRPSSPEPCAQSLKQKLKAFEGTLSHVHGLGLMLSARPA